MTSTLAQGTGPSLAGPPRPLRAFAATRALIALLFGGLALRLTIAYARSPTRDIGGDVDTLGAQPRSRWWELPIGLGPVGFVTPMHEIAAGCDELGVEACDRSAFISNDGMGPLVDDLERSSQVVASSAVIATGVALYATLQVRSWGTHSPDWFGRAEADAAHDAMGQA